MNTRASVFEFKNARDFLVHLRTNYPGRKSPIPLGDWAKRLRYQSHRSLGMVLQGARIPTEQMLRAISRDAGLSTSESRYLGLLAQRDRCAARGLPVEILEQELLALNPRPLSERRRSQETFAQVAEWFMLVLKQLIGTPSFREDAEWIRKRLGNKVSRAEIREALATLERAGVIRRDSHGSKPGKLEDTLRGLFSAIDLPSKAIRKHQRQMMERASEALDEQALHERESLTLTFRMDRKRMKEAKALVREFRDRMDKEFASDDADDVYQLNMQLFSHTRTPR